MTMATIQQQISLSEKRRQRAMALQPQAQTSMPQVYDETTTQGQVYSTRQQLQQAKTPLQQFKSQYLFPKKRERAFTDRRARAQVVQAGQGVAEQLGQIQQQEQTFEREVATKAPEYALQAQKQQALMEAKQSVQAKIDNLNSRIKSKMDSIKNYEQKERSKNKDYSDKIDSLEDDIDVYNAELREYQKAMGLAETDLIKQHFSGYIKQKAQYEADYTEDRNRQQADFRKMKQDPKFQDTLKELKLPSNVSLGQFESAVKKYNNDVAYKNQLLKFAEQKGGVQFLNPEQQKALGFDSQGFDYYKTPQSGYVDPRTGRVIEMSIKDDYAKSMGYLPVQIQGINSKTGEYITSSSTSLLTQQQRRMYDLFQQNPKAAAFLGFNINQSAKLPTDFVLKGSSQPVEYQKPDYFNLLGKPSGSAYEAATRMDPFTTKELKSMEILRKYGYTSLDGNRVLGITDNSGNFITFNLPETSSKRINLLSEIDSYEQYKKSNNIISNRAVAGYEKRLPSAYFENPEEYKKALYTSIKIDYDDKKVKTGDSALSGFLKDTAVQDTIRRLRLAGWTEQEIDNYSPVLKEAKKGLGDKDIRAFYRSVQYGSAIIPGIGIPMSIASGLLLDTTTEKTPTFKELGISTAINTASAYLTNRLVGIGGKGSLLRQGIKTTGFFGSEQLTRTGGIVDYLIPQRSTGFSLSGAPRQVARGGIFALMASNPLMATAYASQFLKTATKDPIGTAKSAKQYILENPYEVLTPTAWRYRRAIRTPIDYITGTRMPKIITTEKFPRIPRDVTTAYLKKGGLIKGFKGYLRSPLKWDILTGSPVKESIGTKVLLSELRAVYNGKYYKITMKNGVQAIKINGIVTPISKLKNVKVLSSGGQKIAYGTPQIGKNTFAMGEVFAESVKRNPTYWKNWVSHAYKYGLRNTIKKYGLPKPKNSNVMLNEGDYYPRKSGESANAYYKRIQSISDKSGRVIVADAPKTVAKTTQPEFEVVYLYPKDAMGNAIVSRVKIGTDSFGRSIYREFPRKISLIERIGTKLEAKKVNYLSYIEGIKKAVAKDTSQFMGIKYSNIYKDTLKWFEGKWDKSDRSHFTNVEKNLREIVKKYNLPYSNDLIRAFARIHDILKLRGLNITDEAIVKKAVKSGALDSIADIKKLSYADKMLLADAIGFHHIANPNLYYNIRLRDFIKAAINADRLDITRYGAKVDPSRLFRIGKRDLLSVEQDILSKNKKYWNSLTNKQRSSILERESYVSEYDYIPTDANIKGYLVGNIKKYDYSAKDSSREQAYRYSKPTTTGYKNYLVGTSSKSYPKTSYKKQQQLSYPNYLISKPSTRYAPTYKRTTKVTTRYQPSKKQYQPPLLPQRTYRAPYQPPRQQPTQPLQKTLIIRQQPKKKIQQERQPIRRPQRYNILPTITQQIYRVKRKGGRVKRPTGFELIRI